MPLRTPLYQTHLKYGARIVEFAGWEMPVQYEGILAEHRAVRQAAGLFDVSHMGEIAFTGASAEKQLQYLLTNDVAGMQPGGVRYSPMCYPDGGAVDDVLVCKRAEGDYLAVVNASNKDKDFFWMLENNRFGAAIEDVSETFAQLALQGPGSEAILSAFVPEGSIPRKYYTFSLTPLFGHPCILSRTGYTGEDGFEIYLRPEDAPLLWETLMEEGQEHGLVPAGLGARDTLRLEAAMPLYGHELSPDITPLEAGLGRFVKPDKPEFIGKEALTRQREEGLKRQRIGLELLDRGIAREGAAVLSAGEPVGRVTSGSFAPWLEKTIAMALVDPRVAVAGETLGVDVRGRILSAKVVKLPFYKR